MSKCFLNPEKNLSQIRAIVFEKLENRQLRRTPNSKKVMSPRQ